MQEITEIFQDDTVVTSRLVGYETPELMQAFARRRQEAEQRLANGDTESSTIIEARRIGRNSPCPCNSGRKFKKCCGANFASTDSRLKD